MTAQMDKASACGAAAEHGNMARLEHLRRCPICNLRLDRDSPTPEAAR